MYRATHLATAPERRTAATKERGEGIAKVRVLLMPVLLKRKATVPVMAGLSPLPATATYLVIFRARLRVFQNIMGCIHVFECRLRVFALCQIRMCLTRQLAVGALGLFRCGIGRDAQGFVRVFHKHKRSFARVPASSW